MGNEVCKTEFAKTLTSQSGSSSSSSSSSSGGGGGGGGGLDESGDRIQVGRDFPQLSTIVLFPTQSPVQRVPGLFPGGKAAGAWC